jgi:signal transduction histidine kinase
MLHLAAELRYNLFLALKETLNNVVKHAQAKEVRLGLRLEAASFTLTVEDDGRGIVAGSAGTAGRIVAGHGLPNLEKRLRSIGGQCRVASVPGQGTRIEMTVRVERPPSPIVATVRNGAPRAESSQ